MNVQSQETYSCTRRAAGEVSTPGAAELNRAAALAGEHGRPVCWAWAQPGCGATSPDTWPGTFCAGEGGPGRPRSDPARPLLGASWVTETQQSHGDGLQAHD